jgi:pimeloyl-ACP methyl ester carboxylesterase
LRTFVPWLRGYGETRFLDRRTMRSGQLAALAQDVLDFADSLGLKHFAIVGHDWGARAAYIASCAAPERITQCAAISAGWGTNDPDQVLSLKQTQNYWYHWYMALERGERLVRDDRRAFTRYIWTIWNRNWKFSEAEFEVTARAFDNPDWADITLHSYRVRWGLAPVDPAYASLEARVKANPSISVPTLMVHGGGDPVNDPSTSEGKEKLFTGPYRRVVLDRVGHFPQREDPEGVCKEMLPFIALRAPASTR